MLPTLIVAAFAPAIILLWPGVPQVYTLADGSQAVRLSAADPTTLALQVQELASERKVLRVAFEGDPRRPTGALVIFELATAGERMEEFLR